MTHKLAAYLEIVDRRTFAGAVDWPGWERSGRDADAALAKLAEYGPRYGSVLARSRLGFEAPDGPEGFDIVERVRGNATTDFGAPAIGPSTDDHPVTTDDLDRLTRILEAAWRTFDRAAEAAEGVTLTVGPRGGGRSLEKIVDHVARAEEGYLNALGSKFPKGDGDVPARWEELRRVVVAALAARAGEHTVEHPRATKRPWTPRFFVRRAAWHVLDHAWELEDRAGTGQSG